MADLGSAVRFMVNGASVEVSPGERSLLAVLREDLGLTGVKEGCSKGHCGSCAVLVNGEVKLACRTAARAVAGAEVVTIEGLGTRESPHPLQTAFVEAGAVQCGFCTPGAIISAKALLDRDPDPTRHEVASALNRNLCRCTGYVKIVDAVMLAAARMRGAQAAAPAAGDASPAASVAGVAAQNAAVGRSYPRRDAWDKVLGTAQFAADISLPGVCHVRVVRSPHAHARLLKVDTAAARALPGVVAVITAADIRGRNAVALFRPDQPVLATGKVRYAGEPVALVVAEDPETAARGARLVRAEYELLPSMLTPEEALGEAAPRIHDDLPNSAFHRRLVMGDAPGALAGAEHVVRGRFTTPHNDHAYLEPDAGLGYLDGDQVVVMCGTQNAQHTRAEVAKVLGVPLDEVRIVQTTTGGGFGGKLDPTFAAMIAVAASVSRRPVRLVYSREETFLATWKRHPFQIEAQLGADAQGYLLGLTMDIVADTGAYLSVGPGVLTRAVTHTTGPYRIKNVLVDARAVHTNGPVSGAMRGFGVPQVTFALESLLDELALAVGCDPLEIRRMNGFVGGDATATGQTLEAGAAFSVTLDALETRYLSAVAGADAFNASAEARERGRRRGVGLAGMWFGPGKTSLTDQSYAFAEICPDGTVRVVTTAADIGQGLETVLAQITADELHMPYERVAVQTRDTEGAPDGGWTCASRQTYNTGNAVLNAAKLLRQSAFNAAAEMLGSSPHDLYLADGEVSSSVDPEARVSFAELFAAGHVRRHYGQYAAEVCELDDDCQGVPYETYTFGSQLAEVEVELKTGRVTVDHVTVAHDVGTAINPLAVEGQLEGGVVMGVGFALKERFVPGETTDLARYGVPRNKETPGIEIIALDTPHEHGPFGAAGAGECAQMPTAPAITNAIFDACGVRVRDLPVTPGGLRALLEHATKGQKA
jgi:aldehyde oxidoreductase